MTKIPRITGKQVKKVLLRKSFKLLYSRGSHFYFEPAGGGTIITVPVHKGKVIKPKTLKSILKQAGMTVDDLIELL